jgi:glyoxylase-like metal-dependent hydrolase (beta-lactamase superfamily II)
MHRFMTIFALATALFSAGLQTAWAQGAHDLAVIELKPGVYLLHRPNPMRIPVEGNTVVIVNADDVVVVDSGGMPLTAENAVRHIRKLTPKPVSVLVNTHWHGDHNFGNQVYREQFPGVRIVSHESTYRNVTSPYNRSETQRLPATLEENLKNLREMKAKGDWNERRELMLRDFEIEQRESAKIRLTPPDLTFTDSLILHRGAREIHIRFLGRANTDGDAIVWLPSEKIIVTGDVVVHPTPYGFGSYPRDWIETLGKIRALPFEILVPGHGEQQRDDAYLQLLQRSLASIREQAAAAVAKNLDLDGFRKSLDATSFESAFVQDDALKKRLFDAWWIKPITKSAWLEASGKPIRQDELE